MVIEIVDKDILKKGNSFYINRAKDSGGMIIVKNDWCIHCRRVLPVLEKTSKKLGTAYPIFKLDGDSNKKSIDLLKIEGFPTIFLINRDGKITKKYEGGRTEQEFLTSICSESLVCRK
jgi:thiol-disulfide isomerase/thioredoxin